MDATLSVLKEARRLIVEKGWTQGAFARGPNGHASGYASATSFCTVGAIDRATYRLGGGVGLHEKASASLRKIIRRRLDQWNDHPKRTKEEVIALFDRAIAEVEAAQ